MALSSHRLGLMWAFGGAVLFGIQVPFVKIAADAGLSPAANIFVRAILVLSVALLVAVFLRQSLRVPQALQRPLLFYGLASAVVGLSYLSSLVFIPVSLATVIFYTFPLWVLIGHSMLSRQGLGWVTLGLFALVFCGLVLAVGPSLEALDWRGLALAGVASLGATAQFLIAPRFARDLPQTTILFWVHVILLLPALVVASFLASRSGLPAILDVFWPMLISALTYLCGMFLQFLAFQRASASSVGLVFSVEPLVSIALAVLLFAEVLSPLQYLGCGLVLCGIFLCIFKDKAPEGA